MKNRGFVVLSGQCSRHCCSMWADWVLFLVVRKKGFVRVFASEMFPTCRVNIQIAQKSSNFSFFFFVHCRDFVKFFLFDVLNCPPAPPPPRHQIPDRNYVAKPSSNVTWSHAPNVSRKCHARRTVTWKLRDRRRTANTTTQDSIHVHPMWLGQSIIYLFIQLVTHKTLYNMNKSC